MTITLSLTTEEARNLAGLIDIALKHPQAGGVAIAAPALALLRKIDEAHNAAQQPQAEE